MAATAWLTNNQDTCKTLIIGLKPEFLFEACLDKTSPSLNRGISLNLAATVVHLGLVAATAWSSCEYMDNSIKLPTYSQLNSNYCFLRILIHYKPKGGGRFDGTVDALSVGVVLG